MPAHLKFTVLFITWIILGQINSDIEPNCGTIGVVYKKKKKISAMSANISFLYCDAKVALLI